jgi:hypothetical protein
MSYPAVVIVDYDPRWPSMFAQLRDRIAADEPDRFAVDALEGQSSAP